jgi:serine protease
MVGSTGPTTDSSVSQTFTLPANATAVSFWYQVHCPDTVTYDWATATLKDNTSGTTTTVLAKTCSNTATWQQASAAVTGGHSVTLTLSNHDDNYSGDPTYTLYDDVAIAAGTPDTTPPTTSITAPAAGSTVSGTVTVTATATDNVGVTKIELYVDGTLLASGTASPFSASWNTTGAANGTHSLTSKAYDAAANVGTSSAVSVTVRNGAVTNPVVNPGFETGTLSGWTASGTAAARAFPHTGSYSGSLGSSSPSTDSTLSQTFTMPAGATTLTVWYRIFCPDTVTYDWATITLKDNVSGTTTTVLPKTCTNTNTWVQASASVSSMAGHSVTLTLANHDDNYAGDATYTDFDDVNVQ